MVIWFTDIGSNDFGSNDIRSNDIRSNDPGSKGKRPKIRQRVKMMVFNVLFQC